LQSKHALKYNNYKATQLYLAWCPKCDENGKPNPSYNHKKGVSKLWNGLMEWTDGANQI